MGSSLTQNYMPRSVTFFEQKIVTFQPKNWENWDFLSSINLTNFAKEFKIHQIFDITNLKTKILAKILLGCCKISSSSFLTDPTNQSGASGSNKVAWRCGISQMSLAETLGHPSNLNHLKRRFRLPLFRKTIQKVECLRFSVMRVLTEYQFLGTLWA